MRGRPWFAANEVLAFLVEIAALAALAWWGFATGGGVVARVVLGIGTPAAAAVLWGLFAAPRARFRPPLPAVLLVKALVLLGAAAAIGALGHLGLAIAFAVVVIANTAAAETLRRR